MRYSGILCGLTALTITVGAGAARAASADELVAVYSHIEQPALAADQRYDLNDFQLTSSDFVLNVEKGFFQFFEPVTIDGQEHYWGGILLGRAQFRFAPKLLMERRQVKRYLGSDTLNREVEGTVLLFNDTLAARIREAGGSSEKSVEAYEDADHLIEELQKHITHRENKSFGFAALQNLVAPQRRPFLLACSKPIDGSDMIYAFNPYDREEVRLYMEYKEFIVSLFMQPVCEYSVYADASYTMLNGIDRERIKCNHYSIDATIDRNGDMSAGCTMQCEAILSGTQLLTMRLHENFTVDSVRIADGPPVPFLRHESWKNRSEDLHLILDRPLEQGEQLVLQMYYTGRVIEHDGSLFHNEAGSDWYPKYGFVPAATFDIDFRTPTDLHVACSGVKTADTPGDEYRRTTWVVQRPTADVSFVLGDYERSEIQADQITVSINLAQKAHETIIAETANRLGRNAPDRGQLIAEDVSNALAFFTEYFGPLDRSSLVVSESFGDWGESYPGLVKLAWNSVNFDDTRGENRLRRSAVVARQWWGDGVLFDSYRDQWLADAFAAYSALMYVQAVHGQDQFMWWLNNYKDHIWRAYGRGEDIRTEYGPVALGYRTAAITNVVATDVHQSRSFGKIRQGGSRETGMMPTVNMGAREVSGTSIEDVLSDDVTGVGSSADSSRVAVIGSTQNSLIAYYRGAYVLHMLRNMLLDLETLDDQTFFDMMNQFYTTWKGKRPTTMDFKQLVDQYTGMDMSWFFDQWVYGYHLPEYKFSYDLDQGEDGNYQAVVHIEQGNVPDGFRMFVPIEIDFGGDRRAYLRLLIDEPEKDITLPPLQSKPKDIRLNPFNSVLAKVDQ